MDKDVFTADDMIGVCEVDVEETVEEGRLAKWYELHYRQKLAGEIFIETIYTEDQYESDSIVNLTTRDVKNGTMRARSGLKAAAKNVIGYVERKPRQSNKVKTQASFSNDDTLSFCELEQILDNELKAA